MPAARHSALPFACAAILLAPIACSSTTKPAPPGAAQSLASRTVYVADFDAAAAQTTGGTTTGPLGVIERPRIAEDLGLPGSDNPQHYVDLMAESIVDDLRAAGITAQRLRPGQAPGPDGFVLRGAYTKLVDGGAARRAMIGFGAGATEVAVAASISDSAHDRPFDVQAMTKSSNLMPGAIVMLNPYTAAARMVMAHGEADREVKRVAQQIADKIIGGIRSGEIERAVAQNR